jgi:hypothetical protein
MTVLLPCLRESKAGQQRGLFYRSRVDVRRGVVARINGNPQEVGVRRLDLDGRGPIFLVAGKRPPSDEGAECR